MSLPSLDGGRIPALKAMVMDHQGKSAMIQRGLDGLGCELVADPLSADVILIDHDVPSHGKIQVAEQCVAAGGRAFIYPHGASAGLIAAWDGLLPVSPIVSGVLTTGPGHAEVARRFGYPHPVHDIGWTFCEQRARVATGRVDNVVFAAQHPKGNGHLSDWKLARNVDIFERLLAARVNLTVRYVDSLEANGIPVVEGVRYVQGRFEDHAGQLAQIDAADVVVSDRSTFSCLAIARGVTTIMFDSTVVANDLDRSITTDNLELYREYIRFPFEAEDAVDILELMHAAARDEDLVGDWRARFVGEPFDAARLLEILHGDGAHVAPKRRAARLHRAAVASVERGDIWSGARLLCDAITGSVDLEILNDLAVVWWNQGRRTEAEALLRVCLALQPNHVSAAENLRAIAA